MSAAPAYKIEYDEVTVSSTEVLESTLIAIRDEMKELKADYKEHKSDFPDPSARLDHDINAAASELRSEIRAMAAKAESDLKDFATRVDTQLREMRAADKELREKVEKHQEAMTERFNGLDKKVTDI